MSDGVHLRLRVKKLGTHYHCRLFSGKAATTTHARNGELVFDQEEWPAVKDQFARIAEIIEDDTSLLRIGNSQQLSGRSGGEP